MTPGPFHKRDLLELLLNSIHGHRPSFKNTLHQNTLIRESKSRSKFLCPDAKARFSWMKENSTDQDSFQWDLTTAQKEMLRDKRSSEILLQTPREQGNVPALRIAAAFPLSLGFISLSNGSIQIFMRFLLILQMSFVTGLVNSQTCYLESNFRGFRPATKGKGLCL